MAFDKSPACTKDYRDKLVWRVHTSRAMEEPMNGPNFVTPFEGYGRVMTVRTRAKTTTTLRAHSILTSS